MSGLKISISDEQSAKQWLAQVQEINLDYRKAMTEATECLTNMKDFADGTIVDELVQFGTDLLNAAEATFHAIDEIADTVNSVLGFVGNFLEGAVGGIAKLAAKTLNR